VNLTAITDQLVQALSQIDGVRAYAGLQDSVLSSTATATAIVVRPGEPYIADYHLAMSKGLARVNMVFEVVAPRNSMRALQERINQLLSSGDGESRSIIDAVRPDDLPNTLNGEVDDFKLGQVSGISERSIGDTEYLGCDIDIEILVRR
jgi:hypothetical protein